MYLVLYCTVLTVACRLSQQVPVLFIIQKYVQYTKKNEHLYINLFFTYQVPVPNKGAGADPKKSSPAPAKKPWLRPAPASGSATLLFWHFFYVSNVVSFEIRCFVTKVNAVTFCPPLYLSCYYLLIFSLGNFPSLSALLSTIV